MVFGSATENARLKRVNSVLLKSLEELTAASASDASEQAVGNWDVGIGGGMDATCNGVSKMVGFGMSLESKPRQIVCNEEGKSNSAQAITSSYEYAVGNSGCAAVGISGGGVTLCPGNKRVTGFEMSEEGKPMKLNCCNDPKGAEVAYEQQVGYSGACTRVGIIGGHMSNCPADWKAVGFSMSMEGKPRMIICCPTGTNV